MANPPARFGYNHSDQYLQLFQPIPLSMGLVFDRATIVVFIDGGCRNNGLLGARGAWGVFLGPNSPYNRWGSLGPSIPQTSQRAEIEALAQALDTIHEIASVVHRGRLVGQVIIYSDSTYVVNSMSHWVRDWVHNGGVTYQGQPVAYFQKWRDVNAHLNSLFHDLGICVDVRHVPRQRNRNADALVRQVFR
ncbi:ribonuclease H-like protein [Hypomontagnella monticulosa]|nr:ribonuclease H-like protein [Hypomontagnella monticulosa]